MSTPAIRGWCPGAHRPMESGDGLVVRVRPRRGTLSPAQAKGLAQAADRFGNGLIDLTSRANLQMRGVTDATHAPLLADLHSLDLLDADPSVEGRRNIVLTPLRPDKPNDMQAWMAETLADALTASEFETLPSKFGFVIDAGEKRHIAETSGDIRIEASDQTLILRAQGLETGLPLADARAAVEAALDLARWFLESGGVGEDGRGRLAHHLKSGAALPASLKGHRPPNPVAPKAKPGPIASGSLIAAAFGQITPKDLIDLAGLGVDLRITPWRMVFLPGISIDALGPSQTLLTDGSSPLLRVEACRGAPRCPQALAETRDLARGLAEHVPEGARLHVSGCAKGCAHPGPSDLTLVGNSHGFDLVRNGAPWDDPSHRGIGPDDLAKLMTG